MKLLMLVCLVAAVTEARPQTALQPEVPHILAAFDAYHQLWLAEAKRNSMAPTLAHQQPAQQQPLTPELPQEQLGAEQPPQKTLAEKLPAQEQLVVEQNSQPIVEVRQAPQQAEVEVVMVQEAEAPAVSMTPAPDMTAAFNNFFTLWEAEAARNAMAPLSVQQAAPAIPEAQEKQLVTLVQETQPVTLVQETQPITVMQQATLQQQQPHEVMVEAPLAFAEPVPDMQAEFARFHKLWKQEADRNSILPSVVNTLLPPQTILSHVAKGDVGGASAKSPVVRSPFFNLGATSGLPTIIVFPGGASQQVV
ncbi:fibrous sheath CABYR-binding protein-like [Homarus americanus]|uniref:fibrous sheath CABYR-binding protein-like n=1 Tax=Homarus americanus TaxID=6706 RepID=UPI001C487A5D|nr:fibrous sheath CABYR-binding protein-like [Homarus americanus]